MSSISLTEEDLESIGKMNFKQRNGSVAKGKPNPKIECLSHVDDSLKEHSSTG